MRATESETREQTINSRWLTTIAIFMIILGIIATVFPFFATITSTLVFGWILCERTVLRQKKELMA